MGLEFSDIDEGSEGGASAAPEKVREQSREQSSSGALAGIAKTKKDESKGKKASNLLSEILISLLRDKRYDPILDPILQLLKHDVPSAYVVGVLSLASKSASDAIRKTYDPALKPVKEPLAELERTAFDPGNLRTDFRDRINAWIEDIFLISTKEPSTILTEKFLAQLSVPENRERFFTAVRSVLIHFFDSKNVDVPESEASNLSAFLIRELDVKLTGLKFE